MFLELFLNKHIFFFLEENDSFRTSSFLLKIPFRILHKYLMSDFILDPTLDNIINK